MMKKSLSFFVVLCIVFTMIAPFEAFAEAEAEQIPDGAVTLLNDDFSADSLDTTVWQHGSPEGTATPPSETLESGRLQIKGGTADTKKAGSYGLFSKKVPLKDGIDTSDGTYLDLKANATLTAIYSVDVSSLDNETTTRALYSGLFNSATVVSGGIQNVIAGFKFYNAKALTSNSAVNVIEYTNGTNTSSADCPDVADSDIYDAASSKFKIQVKITDETGNFYDAPKVTVSYKSNITDGWITKEAANVDLLNISSGGNTEYVDCLFFRPSGSSSSVYADDVMVYVTQNEIPVNEKLLLNDSFDEALDTNVWGYSFKKNDSTREEYTAAVIENNSGALYMKAGEAQGKDTYIGGFYGKFSKKIPITSYTDDGTYYTDLGKNTKLTAEFKIDSTGLNTSSKRSIWLGFHNSDKLNSADLPQETIPYGIRGVLGAKYYYKDNSTADTSLCTYNTYNAEDVFVTGDSVGKISYYKIELTLSDKYGNALSAPVYTVSYRTSESSPWITSQEVVLNEDSFKLEYIDCLYFHFSGSASSISVDDVNVYITDGYSMSLADGDSIIVDSPRETAAVVIFAAYADDGELSESFVKELTLAEGENTITPEGFNPADAAAVKIMLWEDLEKIVPLCPALIK